MKRYAGIITVFILFVGSMGLIYTPFIGPQHANACNWGKSGGGDYVPQERRSSIGPLAKAPSMTEAQAYDVVSNHIKNLNPDLKIGKIMDNGGFYEAEILSNSGDMVERLGVDKSSGRLMVLN